MGEDKRKSNLDLKSVESREEELSMRIQRLEQLEADIKNKEMQLKDKEKSKKQVLLRLAPSLWEDLAAWADHDYRSINSQIEFLLADCVRQRKRKSS